MNKYEIHIAMIYRYTEKRTYAQQIIHGISSSEVRIGQNIAKVYTSYTTTKAHVKVNPWRGTQVILGILMNPSDHT